MERRGAVAHRDGVRSLGGFGETLLEFVATGALACDPAARQDIADSLDLLRSERWFAECNLFCHGDVGIPQGHDGRSIRVARLSQTNRPSWSCSAANNLGRMTARADDFDVAVVGGGIIGLATAHALLNARPTWSVAVLEKERRIAAHQSGRNSGVLHSGIYYRPGSLKARLAVAGRESMLDFCGEHGVPFEICGKLIIAL